MRVCLARLISKWRERLSWRIEGMRHGRRQALERSRRDVEKVRSEAGRAVKAARCREARTEIMPFCRRRF
jgi:hypothetical protein